MRLTFISFAVHCITILGHAAPAQKISNLTKIQFPIDTKDGESVLADFIPHVKDSSAGDHIKSDENEVKFSLCKRRTPCKTVKEGDSCTALNSLVVPHAQLIILIHGFGGNADSQICAGVKKAYLANFDWNVVTVNWAPLAEKPHYGDAMYGAEIVGNALPRLIHHFVEDCKLIALKDVHIIGYSLGAHAAGHTGRKYGELYNGKVGRITGLDPAGPMYTGHPAKDRLDPSDADYVDCIHTNGCSMPPCFGIEDTCGHADFYPNGGRGQPGCWFSSLGCSHRRAVELYEESIKNKKFFRSCCHSSPRRSAYSDCEGGKWDLMGHYSKAKGFCYLDTNKKSPYSKSSGHMWTAQWPQEMSSLTALVFMWCLYDALAQYSCTFLCKIFTFWNTKWHLY